MALILEKKLLFLAALFLGLSVSQFLSSRTLDDTTMNEKHEIWMARYGRVYKDSAEKKMRFRIFKENVEYVESFNKAGNKPYKLGMNEFADQTNEEFHSSRNGYKKLSSNVRSSSSFKYENVTAPTGMDWRKKGAVTGIKDQGQCGINQITTGKLISISEQGLVDCDTSGEDQGCEGGLMDDAFEFIINNKGLAAEANYPYKGVDGTCNRKEEHPSAAKIYGYEDVPSNDEAALLKVVANQPVSVAIDASGSDFQFYSSGLFTGECGTLLDHGVTAVGYGRTSDGTKYWFVKNSWGTIWGENGYIIMQRDIGTPEGPCGIAMESSYPTA